MSQTSPFGHPAQDDPSGRLPEAAPSDDPAPKKARVGLLAIGGTAIVAGAAVAGFLLMSGTSDDSGYGFTLPAPKSPQATSTPSPSASPDPLPTESAVNARNPFLAPPSPTEAVDAGGGSGSPGSGGTTAGPDQGSTVPSAAPSTSVASQAVLVSLVSFNSDTSDAKFTVVSPVEDGTKTWSVSFGQSFGTPLAAGSSKPFTYNGVVDVYGGKECPTVKFVDNPAVTVCKGDPVDVG